MVTLTSSAAAQRPDFAAIANWIKPNSKILDLGCGDGALLKYLQQKHRILGFGVEIDDANVLGCLRNGINVIQSDLESGLSGFADNSFDYVILSQTLQAMKHTERIIREMLRVGREGIVSFPNFGHWKNRLQVIQGHMPVSDALPYHWYDTPNIHLCTLGDFENLCKQCDAKILERRVMKKDRPIRFLPNLRGKLAFYRFERQNKSPKSVQD
ncbi:MAG: methionine biosynthesis protein MetW [Nitrosomonas sp.]|nr:methionine biosynthesis protein MetW [Nitrosomonas sp.]